MRALPKSLCGSLFIAILLDFCSYTLIVDSKIKRVNVCSVGSLASEEGAHLLDDKMALGVQF